MSRQVIAQPLSHEAISGHGLQVIAAPSSPSAAHQGNQGTALVVRGMTSFPSNYSKAPSGKPASCNTAYFRCAPRTVKNGRLRIKVFERHPYTRQAFIPLGTDKYKRAYVVVVAKDKVMCFRDLVLRTRLRLDGKPDLNTVKAFIAVGNMGIVYEANRWHSPMCALDEVCPTLCLFIVLISCRPSSLRWFRTRMELQRRIVWSIF
jgi:allantoicase